MFDQYYEEPVGYACKHLREDVRSCSRSGGAFTALTDVILRKKGVVYGVLLDDFFLAKHGRACNESQRNDFRGSKYIQSSKGDTFKRVKEDLERGNLVLFSGTSCEVAGLLSYLAFERVSVGNLICVDIVCHGVPSPRVWSDYLLYLEEKFDSTVLSVDFRDKGKFGWAAHEESIQFKNRVVSGNTFRKLFYGHYVLRESCFRCPYKSVKHPGDITIADFWGIDQALVGFNDDRGVSLVLVNTDKGANLLNDAKSDLNLIQVPLERCISQPPLKEPFPKPENYDLFWREYETRNFAWIERKYCKDPSVLTRAIRKLRRMAKGEK